MKRKSYAVKILIAAYLAVKFLEWINSIHVIAKEMAAFEEYFKEAVKSRVPLLDRIMRYIVNRKGKQLRPKFVLLSAKLGGEINISTFVRHRLWNYCILPHLCMMM